MFRAVSSFLDSITMYRLVLYGLVVELFYSLLLGLLGKLPYKPLELATSAGILLIVCVFTNKLISRLFRIQTNPESSTITALILYLVLSPLNYGTLILGGLMAIISKYLLVSEKKHLFNPAAVAILILGPGAAAWWVGLSAMLPIVLLVGLLVVAKLRRFHMFAAFFVPAILLNLLSFKLSGENPWLMMTAMLDSWPAIFFGTIMLTEPLTTPPTRWTQTMYGVLVGGLYGVSVRIGVWYWPPEFKLLLANFLSYFWSLKFRFFPLFINKKQLASGIYEFSFSKDPRLVFKPGQFLEWTFKHDNPDIRGVRRYLTIASSPTEKELKISLKINPKKSSSFKTSLLNLRPGQMLSASHLQGDFLMPADKKAKLVFIAGGIGITPFRSMLKYLQDKKENRDITLIYVNNNADEIVYRDIFEDQTNPNFEAVYVLSDSSNIPESWKGRTGRIDGDMIRTEVPDFLERIFYLSGPSSMVSALKKILNGMGIPGRRIVTDYFPGY